VTILFRPPVRVKLRGRVKGEKMAM